MREAQALVRKFHKEVADQPTAPAEPRFRNPDLRANLIVEEALETAFALVGPVRAQTVILNQMTELLRKWATRDGKPDIVEAIDGLCDTIVVCLGTAEDIGVELAPFYEEVMRSNLAKAGGVKDANGKLQKPSGWTKPDLESILAKLVTP